MIIKRKQGSIGESPANKERSLHPKEKHINSKGLMKKHCPMRAKSIERKEKTPGGGFSPHQFMEKILY